MARTLRGRRSDNRCLIDDHMRIRPSESEGAHAGAPRFAVTLPLTKLRIDIKRTIFQINLRIGSAEIQAGRNKLMLEGQGCFNQAGHARSAVQMSNVGFDGAQRAELLSIGTLTKRLNQRRKL